MRATLIPLPDFLDAAIRACEAAPSPSDDVALISPDDVEPSSPEWFLGIVVVLDRKAERRSHLLGELVREGSSINDVTRKDLLVAVPGEQYLVPGLGWSRLGRSGLDELVVDPHKQWDGVGSPGVLMTGVHPDAWAGRLWELVSDEVEQCQSEEAQERIARAIDRSASSVCDYLGLSEADIPSLVLFSLADRRVFVFRYGGDVDDPPYQFFKGIATRRPAGKQRDWLTRAVMDVARESRFVEGPAPELAPASLADWKATRYLPREPDALAWERARG
jgi:hypothetical protein